MPISNPPVASGGGSLPYTHALILLNDDGLTLSQVNVYNDTGATFNFAWDGVNSCYTVTALTPVFTNNKTAVFICPHFIALGSAAPAFVVHVNRVSTTVYQICFIDSITLAQSRLNGDIAFSQTSLEIRIYP